MLYCSISYTVTESIKKPDSCFRPEDTIDSTSKSSCRLRGSCCTGGDLACYGCNPVLLSKGRDLFLRYTVYDIPV